MKDYYLRSATFELILKAPLSFLFPVGTVLINIQMGSLHETKAVALRVDISLSYTSSDWLYVFHHKIHKLNSSESQRFQSIYTSLKNICGHMVCITLDCKKEFTPIDKCRLLHTWEHWSIVFYFDYNSNIIFESWE